MSARDFASAKELHMIARSRWWMGALATLALASSAAAQNQCIEPRLEREIFSCPYDFRSQTPRAPGTTQAVRAVVRRPETPRPVDVYHLPDLRTGPRGAPELLARERALLERLARRTSPTHRSHADVLRRLAETLSVIVAVDELRARSLDQAIHDASGNYRTRLVQRQREAERAARADREATVRVLAQLIQTHPQDRRLDEALYTIAFHLQAMDRASDALPFYHRLLRDFSQSRYVPHAFLAFAEHHFAAGRLPEARQFYERVLTIPPERNPLYGYALYKLAWVHFNAEAFRDSLDAFTRLIEHGRTHPDAPDVGNLVRQARRDVVRPYARVGRPAQALTFFRRLAENEAGATEMLEHLGELYVSTGQWPQAIQSYHELMAALPQSERLCPWQAQVLDATISSLPKPQQVREARRLVEIRGTSRGSRERARACDERAASSLLLLATAWHREAVGTDTQPGTRDASTMALAHEMYSLIETSFPNLESLSLPDIDRRDRPSFAQLAYFHAELLYTMQRWPECARAYERVLGSSPPSQLAADAAYGAVLCYDHHLGARQPPPTPTDRALTARELTDDEKRMGQTFACFLAAAPRHEERPVVLYRYARLYYEANQFEASALLFRKVALDHPRSEVAEYAANLYLDALNVLATRRNRPECFAALESAVETFSNTFCSASEAAAHPDLCGVVHEVTCVAAARRASQLGRSGRHAEAARAILALIRAPRLCAPQDVHLYNAALEFEAARLLGRAIRVRTTLVNAYPQSRLAHRSIYLIGANYHALAIYDQAAEFYERYARAQGARSESCTAEERTHRICPDAAEGLKHAVLFRLGLGDTERALADAGFFEQLYRRSRPQLAAEVMFAIGSVFEREERFAELIAHYRAFLRNYPNARPDLSARAHVAMARASLRENDRARATPHLEAAIAIQAQANEQAFAALSGDERASAMAFVRDAASEALFQLAEAERARFLAIAFPRLRGRATVARVNAWANAELRPWLVRKVEALQRAQRAYDRVYPLAIPSWRIASASQIGDMVMSIVDTVRGSPVPAEIESDPELLDIYWDAIEEVVRPHEQEAVARYQHCLATATENRWFDGRSQECERALNRLDAARFPVASELGGRPDRTPTDGAEPGPVRLRTHG